MKYIDDDVRRQVIALEHREKGLSRRVKHIAMGLGGLSSIAIGAGVLVSHFAPNTKPSTIDIPTVVLNQFSTHVGSSGPLTSGNDAVFSLLSSLQPAVMTVGAIGVTIAGVASLLSGDSTRLLKALVSGIMALGTLAVMTKVVLPAIVGEPQTTPREEFVRFVEERRAKDLALILSEKKLGSTPPGQYLLAQVTLAQDTPNASIGLNIDEKLAQAVAVPTSSFAPKGEALYAIEHAAYGKAKSAAALAYQADRNALQGTIRAGQYILLVITAGTLVAGLSIFFLQQIIGRRLRRVRDLIGQPQSPLSGARNNHVKTAGIDELSPGAAGLTNGAPPLRINGAVTFVKLRRGVRVDGKTRTDTPLRVEQWGHTLRAAETGTVIDPHDIAQHYERAESSDGDSDLAQQGSI
jgi:hypothetical protein